MKYFFYKLSVITHFSYHILRDIKRISKGSKSFFISYTHEETKYCKIKPNKRNTGSNMKLLI